MSDYRDDTQETVVISSRVLSGLASVTEDVLRLSDKLLFGLLVVCSSTVYASDEVIDTTAYSFSEVATVTDTVIDTVHAAQTHVDSAKVFDNTYHNLRVIQTDSATITDSLLHVGFGNLHSDSVQINDSTTGQRTAYSLITDSIAVDDTLTAITKEIVTDSVTVVDNITDQLIATQLIDEPLLASDVVVSSTAYLVTDYLKITDELIANRTVSSLVQETATITDELLFNQSDLIIDSAVAHDALIGSLYAHDLISDSANIDSAVIDTIIQRSVIADSAQASDEVFDKVAATVSWHDVIVIDDDALNVGGYRGQAWTANIDSWAMSRYEPYNYNRLVVINGVLYGEADDGIYRLDQADQVVTASIKTGKMDLGQGQLTHPSTAYLEYELDGQASMTVHSTQKGYAENYTYVLPNELAGELTNGRFIFGRGLRGRHFSFELTMTGKRGHVNDLTVEHMPAKRRV